MAEPTAVLGASGVPQDADNTATNAYAVDAQAERLIIAVALPRSYVRTSVARGLRSCIL